MDLATLNQCGQTRNWKWSNIVFYAKKSLLDVGRIAKNVG